MFKKSLGEGRRSLRPQVSDALWERMAHRDTNALVSVNTQNKKEKQRNITKPVRLRHTHSEWHFKYNQRGDSVLTAAKKWVRDASGHLGGSDCRAVWGQVSHSHQTTLPDPVPQQSLSGSRSSRSPSTCSEKHTSNFHSSTTGTAADWGQPHYTPHRGS